MTATQQVEVAAENGGESWRSVEDLLDVLAVDYASTEGTRRPIGDVEAQSLAAQATALTITEPVPLAEEPLRVDTAAQSQPSPSSESQNMGSEPSPRSAESDWSVEGRHESSRSSLTSVKTVPPLKNAIATKRVPFARLADVLSIYKRRKESLGIQLKKSLGGVSSHVARMAPKFECTSCLEQVQWSRTVRLQCKHHYCGPCFVQLIEVAMRTESMFPPKCCLREVPHRLVLKQLSFRGKMDYSRREREYVSKSHHLLVLILVIPAPSVERRTSHSLASSYESFAE